jgi:hypothetical protein
MRGWSSDCGLKSLFNMLLGRNLSHQRVKNSVSALGEVQNSPNTHTIVVAVNFPDSEHFI